MCRAKKEENNGAAPLRSVSGEVFATFASLLLVALVLMCMLQTGLSCAYFAINPHSSSRTAVLSSTTAIFAMALSPFLYIYMYYDKISPKKQRPLAEKVLLLLNFQRSGSQSRIEGMFSQRSGSLW